jgi:hypothetical protein
MTLTNKAMLLAPLTLAIMLGGCGGEASKRMSQPRRRLPAKRLGR